MYRMYRMYECRVCMDAQERPSSHSLIARPQGAIAPWHSARITADVRQLRAAWPTTGLSRPQLDYPARRDEFLVGRSRYPRQLLLHCSTFAHPWACASRDISASLHVIFAGSCSNLVYSGGTTFYPSVFLCGYVIVLFILFLTINQIARFCCFGFDWCAIYIIDVLPLLSHWLF